MVLKFIEKYNEKTQGWFYGIFYTCVFWVLLLGVGLNPIGWIGSQIRGDLTIRELNIQNKKLRLSAQTIKLIGNVRGDIRTYFACKEEINCQSEVISNMKTNVFDLESKYNLVSNMKTNVFDLESKYNLVTEYLEIENEVKFESEDFNILLPVLDKAEKDIYSFFNRVSIE